MLAREVMSPKPEFIPPTLTLQQAAEQMRDHDYGFIPIGENDQLIGTITDRDLAIRGLAYGKDASATKVSDIMTKGVHCCSENDDVKEVVHKMEQHQIRRCIVLNENKRMVGIISAGDIALKCNPELCKEFFEEVSKH